MDWEAWDERNFIGTWGCPVCGCDKGHNLALHTLSDEQRRREQIGSTATD